MNKISERDNILVSQICMKIRMSVHSYKIMSLQNHLALKDEGEQGNEKYERAEISYFEQKIGVNSKIHSLIFNRDWNTLWANDDWHYCVLKVFEFNLSNGYSFSHDLDILLKVFPGEITDLLLKNKYI